MLFTLKLKPLWLDNSVGRSCEPAWFWDIFSRNQKCVQVLASECVLSWRLNNQIKVCAPPKDCNEKAAKIKTESALKIPFTGLTIFHPRDSAIEPLFRALFSVAIFRAYTPCPFSMPNHSLWKRHEKAHNEHNATLWTCSRCFIIKLKDRHQRNCEQS